MLHNRLMTLGTVALLLTAAAAGCVKRKETVTVSPDEAVTIELEYEGSEKELFHGDAMPSAESGWDVARSTEKDGDDVKHILKSVRRFAPNEELPHSFATPNNPDADLYLDFPTTLRTERRSDGLYFYFRRVYTPRRWAYVEHWRDEFFDDNIKKLGDKPVEELTLQEKTQIVEAFAAVEAFKQIEFTGIALAESHPGLPVEYGLMARRALFNVYEQEEGSFEGIITRCEAVSEEERNACFDAEAERLLDMAYAAFVRSLQVDAAFAESHLVAFERAYERAERYYQISDALGGHNFSITVVMPGTIIAHSALGDEVEVDEDENSSSVSFDFDGKWFRDCPYELIVVSRLGDKPKVDSRSRIDDSGE